LQRRKYFSEISILEASMSIQWNKGSTIWAAAGLLFAAFITGLLYQQFAATTAISVILSAFNALTLSPALSALLLKPKSEQRGPLAKFFGWFNRAFGRATDGYIRWSGALIRKSAFALIALIGFGIAAGVVSGRVPVSFLPDEDQGYLFLHLQLPEAASLNRTDEACRRIEKILADTPGVQYTTTVEGFSLLRFVRTSYNGFFFVTLKEWDERKSHAEQYHEIVQHRTRSCPSCRTGLRSASRLRRSPASAHRADSLLCLKIVPGGMCRFSQQTSTGSWRPRASVLKLLA
jgi:HAE1 family hydrophobic/amphiphilic exporter-1